MSKLTSKQYVNRGGMACPSCGETDGVSTGDMDNVFTHITVNCDCSLCKAEWVDIYTLSSYDNLEE